jgi:ribosomal protein S19
VTDAPHSLTTNQMLDIAKRWDAHYGGLLNKKKEGACWTQDGKEFYSVLGRVKGPDVNRLANEVLDELVSSPGKPKIRAFFQRLRTKCTLAGPTPVRFAADQDYQDLAEFQTGEIVRVEREWMGHPAVYALVWHNGDAHVVCKYRPAMVGIPTSNFTPMRAAKTTTITKVAREMQDKVRAKWRREMEDGHLKPFEEIVAMLKEPPLGPMPTGDGIPF